MKKPICMLLCCVITVFLLSGCSMNLSGKKKPVRYDIPEAILSLDPQFASAPSARMIIANIHEGLMVYGENGELEPGVAESCEISPDGKKLTFKLRDDAFWEDGSPVTADDFVFAFQRMFTPGSPSPYAGDYVAIENADKILERTRGLSSLGVEAKSKKELEIRLRHPSPFFPGLLAETPAMPCNEQFFNESRGRYGIDINYLNSNGPFKVDRWDNEAYIYLRPNEKYSSPKPALSGGVNLNISAEDTVARLQSGAADIAEVSFDDVEKLKSQGYATTEYVSTVWCIVFNQNSPVWGNPLLRQGLSHTIEQRLLGTKLPKKFSPTDLFIPPSAMLADSNYRENADVSPAGFGPEQGRRLFEMGLSALSIDNISDTVFYVPDSAEHLLAMGMVQQSWQKYLSAYVNVEPVAPEQIEQNFLTGDYEMMLFPFYAETPRAETILSALGSDSPANRLGYSNALYDSLLKGVMDASSLKAAAEACGRAETMLLQDAVIIPVYVETTSLAVASGVQGINATPYPARLSFKYADKK